MSCEDEIRWEVFRPLSSPLNSVVSFSAAPHQKGENKTREEKGKRSGGSLKEERNNNVRHSESEERGRKQGKKSACRGERKSLGFYCYGMIKSNNSSFTNCMNQQKRLMVDLPVKDTDDEERLNQDNSDGGFDAHGDQH